MHAHYSLPELAIATATHAHEVTYIYSYIATCCYILHDEKTDAVKVSRSPICLHSPYELFSSIVNSVEKFFLYVRENAIYNAC